MAYRLSRKAFQPKKPTSKPKEKAPRPVLSKTKRENPLQPSSRRICPHCGRRIE